MAERREGNSAGVDASGEGESNSGAVSVSNPDSCQGFVVPPPNGLGLLDRCRSQVDNSSTDLVDGGDEDRSLDRLDVIRLARGSIQTVYSSRGDIAS